MLPLYARCGTGVQGVTLIALDKATRLIGVQRIVENDASSETPGDESDNPESP